MFVSTQAGHFEQDANAYGNRLTGDLMPSDQSESRPTEVVCALDEGQMWLRLSRIFLIQYIVCCSRCAWIKKERKASWTLVPAGFHRLCRECHSQLSPCFLSLHVIPYFMETCAPQPARGHDLGVEFVGWNHWQPHYQCTVSRFRGQEVRV